MKEFNGLEITEVDVSPMIKIEGNPLLANVRMVLNNIFVITGIKIIEGKFGLFVSMPRVYDPVKKCGQNYAFPITKSFHEYMSKKILKEYNNLKAVA